MIDNESSRKSPPTLAPYIDSDEAGTCITVNQRLARALRNTFDAERLSEGLLSWETPDILPFSAWLQRSWEEYRDRSKKPLPVLLGPFQEHALWDRIIRETQEPTEVALLQVSSAAQHAMDAWARIKGWRVPEQEYRAPWDEDARAFSHWAKVFVRLCRTHNWTDPGSALDALIEAIRAKEIDIPKRFILAGFDEFTPRQQDLLETLGNSGTQITHWAPQPYRNTRHSGCVRICLADEEKELEAAARWARALIERGVAGPIGIVIPALTGMRSAVLRVFDGILRPEAKYAIEELDT
ncbi:MAG: hypothetical protein KJO08_00260, partial [Gammaproteobacteria bacterium]|nr:hypothetical protein [Gammaproteobacteria bacterium]NNJ85311.1 hypothetical protein [Gammaproteobacteria bacterium]